MITLVTQEIRAQYEKIERAEMVIQILDTRRADLTASRDIVRSRMDDFKAKKKKPAKKKPAATKDAPAKKKPPKSGVPGKPYRSASAKQGEK